MTGNKDLKGLPSKVILPDGDTSTLSMLTKPEQIDAMLSICQNINVQMSAYYSSHAKNWSDFLKSMMHHDIV